MSARGVLVMCRCGTACASTGARVCDCDPVAVGRVEATLPPSSQWARATVLASLRDCDPRRALRDAAWLVRGGVA